MNSSSNTTSVIAQVSDSHLFADQGGLHHGANVYQNLSRVFKELASLPGLQAIFFTGDLTQDHSEQSYQLFVDALAAAFNDNTWSCPLYWLAGNHDDKKLLTKLLVHPQISAEKVIELQYWRIHLLDSTTDTPAGAVSEQQLLELRKNIPIKNLAEAKSDLVFMHHHPLDVGYFIDQHGLQNQQQFWQHVNVIPSVKAVCCGHIHRGLTKVASNLNAIPLYACPATSIQFDPNSATVAALNQGPGYRLLTLFADGTMQTTKHYLSK